MKKTWSDNGWEEYLVVQQDKRLLKRVNALLKDIERDPCDGIGKPEALKGKLSGYYSRRIDDEHRLIYRIVDNIIEIEGCYSHYHQ